MPDAVVRTAKVTTAQPIRPEPGCKTLSVRERDPVEGRGKGNSRGHRRRLTRCGASRSSCPPCAREVRHIVVPTAAKDDLPHLTGSSARTATCRCPHHEFRQDLVVTESGMVPEFAEQQR